MLWVVPQQPSVIVSPLRIARVGLGLFLKDGTGRVGLGAILSEGYVTSGGPIHTTRIVLGTPCVRRGTVRHVENIPLLELRQPEEDLASSDLTVSQY